MPRFYYQAQSAQEQQITGQLLADSLVQAVAQLESQGLVVLSISSTPLVGAEGGENPFASGQAMRQTGGAGSTVERAVLEQHMLRVIERGTEILPALQAYAQELPARRRRELEVVLGILQRGNAAEAASAIGTLPGYWIPLLGAATASRDPGRILREFVRESQRALELQRQWWLALSYPLLLGGLALAVLAALSIFVIPIFRDIFTGFGLRLPAFTVFVLTVADWIASGRVLIVAALLLIAAVVLRQSTRLLPEYVLHWCGDHLGLWWGRPTALARFSQFTADLLEAELGVPQAVRLAGIATGNPPIRRAASRAASDLDAGSNLDPSGSKTILTATVLHALRSNTAATSRIGLLREISASYADRARRRLSWTRGIIEPLAVCVIGLVVGGTVLALFLPLVSLIHGLS
jgi:type II secretory pathway component PulF